MDKIEFVDEEGKVRFVMEDEIEEKEEEEEECQKTSKKK